MPEIWRLKQDSETNTEFIVFIIKVCFTGVKLGNQATSKFFISGWPPESTRRLASRRERLFPVLLLCADRCFTLLKDCKPFFEGHAGWLWNRTSKIFKSLKLLFKLIVVFDPQLVNYWFSSSPAILSMHSLVMNLSICSISRSSCNCYFEEVLIFQLIIFLLPLKK